MDFSINSLLASSAASYDKANKNDSSFLGAPAANKETRNATLEALSATLASAQNKTDFDSTLEQLVNIDLELSGIEEELSGYDDYAKMEMAGLEALMKRLNEIQKALNKIDEALEKIRSSNKLKEEENRMVESNIEKSALLRSQLESLRQSREKSEKPSVQ